MDRRKTDRRKDTSSEVYIPDLGDLIRVINKRKILILFIIALPVCTAAFYLKSMPKTYVATSSVILEAQNVNLSDFQDILQSTKFDNLTVPTQIEVITSSSLIKKTIADLKLQIEGKDKIIIGHDETKQNLATLSVKEFLDHLHVNQQGTSRVINISFKAKNPGIAAKIVNTHTRNYVFSQVQAKKAHAAKINKWISEQIDTLKKESLQKSQEVQRFKSEHGMVQGLNSQDLIYQQISDIAKQLSPIETKELDLQSRVELMKSGKTDSISAVIESDLVQRLKSRSSEISQKLKSLKADFGDNHPDVLATRQEQKQILSDINREISNIRKSIENELETTVNQKKLLNEKLTELQEKADTLQSKQIELQSLEFSESASKKQLDNFFARSEEIKSQIDFTRSDVNIVSEADIPTEAVGSKKALILAIVLFLSAGLALAIVLILELTKKGISKKEDVKRLLNIRLLGTLPKEKSPLSNILSKQRSVYVEEMKRIYIHLTSDEACKTILFTSAQNYEGKTITAVALAYFLKSIEKKVLIIDANTVKPDISNLTGTQREPGFYELLSKKNKLEDVIITDEHGVSVIPAGAEVSLSSDLLLSGAFTPHINALKEQYDHIIIDTAPANETSDAEAITKHCDQTVILCTWEKTPVSMLKEITESLRAMSPNLPSVILNKIPLAELKH